MPNERTDDPGTDQAQPQAARRVVAFRVHELSLAKNPVNGWPVLLRKEVKEMSETAAPQTQPAPAGASTPEAPLAPPAMTPEAFDAEKKKLQEELDAAKAQLAELQAKATAAPVVEPPPAPVASDADKGDFVSATFKRGPGASVLLAGMKGEHPKETLDEMMLNAGKLLASASAVEIRLIPGEPMPAYKDFGSKPAAPAAPVAGLTQALETVGQTLKDVSARIERLEMVRPASKDGEGDPPPPAPKPETESKSIFAGLIFPTSQDKVSQ